MQRRRRSRDPLLAQVLRALRRRSPRVLAVLGVVVQALPAAAGRVEGHVTLAPLPASTQTQAALDPYAGNLGSICTGGIPVVSSRDDVRDVVICVEGAPGGPATPGPPPQLAQRGQSFVPRVLAVPVGTTVEFPNFDPIFHNVFSYSKAKRFDLGKYGQGKSARVTFDRPGLVKVFCDIHANMAAYIDVTPTRWVVQPDETGRFALDGVPDGTYTLRLWHPEHGTRTQTVIVTSGATRVDLQF